MFDIGWSELVVIAVVALIAIGPKELPGVLRSAGQWMGKIRKMAAEFQGQFQEAMREAEMADLKKHADDLNTMAKGLTSDLTSTFDSYDPLKESQTATAKPPAADATPVAAASGEPNAAAGEHAPPPPDITQVAAMPEITLPAEAVVAPAPAVASEAAPAVRREA
jgi:sec-independent protein translocase protein TatB